MSYSTFCAVVPFYSLLELFLPVCATDNAPLGVGTFFGGVVAGVASVLLIEVCVLGVSKWRRRMKKPAASKEKEGIRFVSMIIIIIINARKFPINESIHCFPLSCISVFQGNVCGPCS